MNRRFLISLISWTGIGMLLFFWLDKSQTYHYAYLEQFRLFHTGWDYWTGLCSRPGGWLEYITTWLVQYFDRPLTGSILHTALSVGSGIGIQCLWKKLVPSSDMPLFYVLPPVLLLFASMDAHVHTEGYLAFFLTLLLLNLHIRIGYPILRNIGTLTGTWILYHLTGPASICYLMAALCYEWNLRSPYRRYAVFLLPVALLPHILWYLTGNGETLRMIFLPDAYTNPRTEVPSLLYWAWASIPCLFFFAYLHKRYNKPVSLRMKGISIVLQLLAAGGLFHHCNETYNLSGIYQAKEMDYHIRHQETDKLLAMPLRPNENLLHACYQNLALAQKGILADKGLKYRQSGTRGLWIEWNSNVPICTLLSNLYYTIGHIALAQRYAFEGVIASERAVNPYLFLRLIQTNLIFGHYPVAEKYIRLLEDTRYGKQANSYRKFLNNDRAVEEDPELGYRRKSITGTDGLSEMFGLPNDFLQIVNSCPENKQAFAYIGMYILLGKDIPMFRKFIETYHTSEGLHPMPQHFQEAVILSYEAQPERWEEYGVTEATRKRFEGYKSTTLANKRNPSLANKLRATYGDTYWYYYIYNK